MGIGELQLSRASALILPVFLWAGLTASASVLPFTEDVEGFVDSDDVNGTNGWLAAPGVATASSTEVNGGTLSLAITEGSLTNTFSSTTGSNVWYEFYTLPQFRELDETNHPSLDSDTTAAFYINSNGYFVAYNGSTGVKDWQILTNTVVGGTFSPLSTSTWIRVNVALNYYSNSFSLFVNSSLIAEGFGFYSNSVNYFSESRVTDSNSVSYIDDIAVSNDYQGSLTGDSDFDNLADAWEIYYFTSIGIDPGDDPDGDGFNNLQEFNNGTHPLNALSFPAGNQTIPYIEDFEFRTLGVLNGQNGWVVNPSTYASVQSSDVYEGSQAGSLTNAEAKVEFSNTSGHTNVWTDFYTQPGLLDFSGTPETNGVASLFYVNADGYPTVWSNGTFYVISTNVWGQNITPIGSNDWVRFIVKTDYVNARWSLFLADATPNVMSEMVISNYPFADGTVSAYTGFITTNGGDTARYLDAITISTNRPDVIDSDNDLMPDNFEDTHGTPNANDDDDLDGFSNLEEYIAGTIPTNAQSYLGIYGSQNNDPDLDLQIVAGLNRTIGLYAVDENYNGSLSLLATNYNPRWGSTNLTIRDVGPIGDSGLENRFYELTVNYAGMTVTSIVRYALFKQERTQGGWHRISVPVDVGSGTNLNSGYGQLLREGLTGGASDGTSDNLWIQNSSGSWVQYWLDNSDTWNLSGGGAADLDLEMLKGFWVKRYTSGPASSTAALAGPVFTNDVTITVPSGTWYMVSWPFPSTRLESDGANGWGFSADGAVSGNSWEDSDRMFIEVAGRLKAIYLGTGGRWYLKNTTTGVPAYAMEPGKAFYYYTRKSGGLTWNASMTP